MRGSRVWPVLVGALHGLVYGVLFGAALVFPDTVWASMALVAPCALISLALRTGSPVRAGLGAAAGVLPMWGWLHQWIWTNDVSRAGYLIMLPYLSAYAFAYVWGVGQVRRGLGARWGIAGAVVVWAGLEFVRGEVLFYGYPWFLTAHPMIGADAWRAAASAIGTYGVGLVQVVVSVALVVACVPGVGGLAGVSRGLRAAAALVVVAGLVAAVVELPEVRGGGRSARVAVVQTNVPQQNKMAWEVADRVRDFQRFVQLTTQAAGSEPAPSMILWPETMFPGLYGLTPDAAEAARAAGVELGAREGKAAVPLAIFNDELMRVQEWIGIPMIIGSNHVEGLRFVFGEAVEPDVETGAEFNSAFVVDGGRVTDQRYDKRGMTPFGEVLPYVEVWPWLAAQVSRVGAHGMSFGLSRGTGPVVVEVRDASGGEPFRVAAPICFEATMAGLCRRLAYGGDGERDAELMVNLTNDGWFGEFDAGRRLHMLCARWRCAELGIPMVRAANTGVSAVISAGGVVMAEGPGVDGASVGEAARVDGVMIADVELAEVGEGRGTLYARVGDGPMAVCAVVAGGIVVGGWWKGRRMARGGGEPAIGGG